MSNSRFTVEALDLDASLLNAFLFVLILGFFVIAYFKLIKRGEVWGVFHNYFVFSIIIPLFFGFYATSINNVSRMGFSSHLFLNEIDNSFFITCVGSISVLFGHFIVVIFNYRLPLFEKNIRLFGSGVFSASSSVFVYLLLFSIVVLVVALLANQFGLASILTFKIRGEFMLSGSGFFRTLYNVFFTGIVPVLFLIIGISFIKPRSLLPYLGLFFIVTVTLISGTRAVALVLLLNMLMIWIITLKNAKVLFFAVICSPFVLGAAVYIGLIRNDEFYLSNSVELFTGTLLYGNEFSDIRDFGWILTGWDGHYRQGITYVAALFSFIPSDIFTWRRENGMVWQLTGPLGLMDQGHTGLRPGPFGESFINFGYLGVISMGLFLGTLSTLIDNGLSRIKSSVQSRLAYTCAGFTIFGLFAMFSNTSGFFAFYASIIVFATILTIANSTKRI